MNPSEQVPSADVVFTYVLEALVLLIVLFEREGDRKRDEFVVLNLVLFVHKLSVQFAVLLEEQS